MLHLLKKGELFASAGGGSSGGKFLSLQVAKDHAMEAGFALKPRIEVKTGFFPRLLKDSGMAEACKSQEPFEKISALASKASWNKSEFGLFEQISEEYRMLGEQVIMVRANSVLADAGGNGIYLSKAVLNTPENLADAAKEVLLSFFLDKARMAREMAGIQEDRMALMFEPMVHDSGGLMVSGHHRNPTTNFYKEDFGPMYAPRLSGVGRTMTPYGVARIGFVAGLAFNYMENPRSGMALNYYQKDTTLEMIVLADSMSPFKRGTAYNEDVTGGTGTYMTPAGGIFNGKMLFPQYYLEWQEWTSAQLFDMMERLEKTMGREQAIEWAMVRDNKMNPIYYLNQRADYDQPFFDVSRDVDKELVAGTDGLVMGAGRVRIRHIARIIQPRAWSDLQIVNEKYPGYALSIGEESDSFNILPPSVDISFRNLSNSSALLADSGCEGLIGLVEAHVGGSLTLTKKMVVAFDEFSWDLVRKNAERVDRMPHGIDIYETDLILEASEKGQKAVLYLNKQG
ncbi:MAG: hypothetical protein NTX79_05615 [Candidatus Micrarchaeota archaeon]|nr:hypothetical protein [Candidatus Micrarchaeota archaeon]